MKQPVKILFICSHNACRSQMAEAFARQYGGDQVVACSAGTDPTELHALTVEGMREVGIDMSGQYAKGFGQVPPDPDIVVTVCDVAAETCPFFPGARQVLHWSFEDPAAAKGSPEERLAVFRRVRDEIAVRVRHLLRDLGAIS